LFDETVTSISDMCQLEKQSLVYLMSRVFRTLKRMSLSTRKHLLDADETEEPEEEAVWQYLVQSAKDASDDNMSYGDMATRHTAQRDIVNERDLIKITYRVMIHGVTRANASNMDTESATMKSKKVKPAVNIAAHGYRLAAPLRDTSDISRHSRDKTTKAYKPNGWQVPQSGDSIPWHLWSGPSRSEAVQGFQGKRCIVPLNLTQCLSNQSRPRKNGQTPIRLTVRPRKIQDPTRDDNGQYDTPSGTESRTLWPHENLPPQNYISFKTADISEHGQAYSCHRITSMHPDITPMFTGKDGTCKICRKQPDGACIAHDFAITTMPLDNTSNKPKKFFFSLNPRHWSDATSSSIPTTSTPASSSKLLQSQVVTTEVEEQEEESGGSDDGGSDGE
jgi:hypothetical protein